MGAGQGEERTENMLFMAVTLEVSKLSGWLNADALCREERGACGVERGIRVGGQQAVDDRAAQVACTGEDATADWGAGHGEERTLNMYCMSVTLEVLKLSGWLNADRLCRGSKEGHAVRGEVYGSGGSRR